VPPEGWTTGDRHQGHLAADLGSERLQGRQISRIRVFLITRSIDAACRAAEVDRNVVEIFPEQV
jgi:hypothetical protein